MESPVHVLMLSIQAVRDVISIAKVRGRSPSENRIQSLVHDILTVGLYATGIVGWGCGRRHECKSEGDKRHFRGNRGKKNFGTPHMLEIGVFNCSPRGCHGLRLSQANNFHFRLKEEMLDYYHDIQHLIPGRGVALYTS